jgi:hypothetical protein
MTTLSFTLEINELDRGLLEHVLAELEKEYQADPANELAISLGRKSRYELLLDKIKNSKINIASTSSFVMNEPVILPFNRPE